MTQRLTVVLAHSRHHGGTHRELEETIITKLLMEPSVDLTIVPHLEDIHPHDTSQLCLEGIRGPFVVLSWMTTDEAHAVLQKLGIMGWPGRTTHEATRPLQSGGRPIYFLTLAQYPTVDSLLTEIRRIRDDLRTPLVSPDCLHTTLGYVQGPSLAPVIHDGDTVCAPASSGGQQTARVESTELASVVPPNMVHTDSHNAPSVNTPDDQDVYLDTLLDALDRFLE